MYVGIWPLGMNYCPVVCLKLMYAAVIADSNLRDSIFNVEMSM